VVWLSFERRTPPYMAAAVSACTDAMAKLARVTVAVLCPLASHVGSPWSVRTPQHSHSPPAPPQPAGAASPAAPCSATVRRKMKDVALK